MIAGADLDGDGEINLAGCASSLTLKYQFLSVELFYRQSSDPFAHPSHTP